jgi:hypothetical protein
MPIKLEYIAICNRSSLRRAFVTIIASSESADVYMDSGRCVYSLRVRISYMCALEVIFGWSVAGVRFD